MLTTESAKDLIDQAFEEQALVVGGLVAIHSVEDQFVWRLMRSFAAIRRRIVRACEELGGESGGAGGEIARTEPHPAIEGFLRTLGGA